MAFDLTLCRSLLTKIQCSFDSGNTSVGFLGAVPIILCTDKAITVLTHCSSVPCVSFWCSSQCCFYLSITLRLFVKMLPCFSLTVVAECVELLVKMSVFFYNNTETPCVVSFGILSLSDGVYCSRQACCSASVYIVPRFDVYHAAALRPVLLSSPSIPYAPHRRSNSLTNIDSARYV